MHIYGTRPRDLAHGPPAVLPLLKMAMKSTCSDSTGLSARVKWASKAVRLPFIHDFPEVDLIPLYPTSQKTQQLKTDLSGKEENKKPVYQVNLLFPFTGTSSLVPWGWSMCGLCLRYSGNHGCKALGFHACGLVEACLSKGDHVDPLQKLCHGKSRASRGSGLGSLIKHQIKELCEI